MDKQSIAWAICRAATPENIAELQHYGNAGPIADAVLAAIHETGVSNKPLNADAHVYPVEAKAEQPAVTEQLWAIVQVVADADSEDCVGSLDVDIPKGGYPRQWLREAAQAALAQSSTPPANKGVEADVELLMDAAGTVSRTGDAETAQRLRQVAELLTSRMGAEFVPTSPTPNNDTLQGRGEIPLFCLFGRDEPVAIARCDMKRGQIVTADMLKNVSSEDTRHDG